MPNARKKDSQNIFPEASFPLSLIEEVIKMTAESNQNKTKGQESKYALETEK